MVRGRGKGEDKIEPFSSDVPPETIAREKAKARELRASQWWKRKRASGLCYYCGRKFSPRALTMDHRIPLIRGGKSDKGNLVPACKACNHQKKYLLPFEWERYLQSLPSRCDSE